MTRNPKLIIQDIKELLSELEISLSGQPTKSGRKTALRNGLQSPPKGALGAITMLIEEGFFNGPKEISKIMGRLKEMGYYYTHPAVAMNLLNLTKRRALNRFKNRETKNWEYVIRK